MRSASRKSSTKPSTIAFGSPSSSSSCSSRKISGGLLPASISAPRPPPNLFNEHPIGTNFFLSSSRGCTGIARHRQYLWPLAPQLFLCPVVPAYYRCYLEPRSEEHTSELQS